MRNYKSVNYTNLRIDVKSNNCNKTLKTILIYTSYAFKRVSIVHDTNNDKIFQYINNLCTTKDALQHISTQYIKWFKVVAYAKGINIYIYYVD